ncbi:MAG: TolC family protein [Pirellulales bacterium]
MARWVSIAATICLAMAARTATAQRLIPTYFPEQRRISVRDPSQLPPSRLPMTPDPSTVSSPQPKLQKILIPLDRAIRMSIDNVNVVRVLAGTTAVNSGSTIYDPAITNTTIDEANAIFDPVFTATNNWNRLENPQSAFDPFAPGGTRLFGIRDDQFQSSLNLTKENAFGGIFGLGLNNSTSRLTPGRFPLNPEYRSSTEINYTQPLLQGGRVGANLAPIVLARIDTERSFFQLKDAMQDNVQGVIQAYWNLVAARTDVWARRTQVEQLTEILRRVEATIRQGTGSAADRAQAVLALANFRANLIASEANAIQSEAILRNIAGLPPVDGTLLVPNTPPETKRFMPDWNWIVQLAGERRPDIVELKLIIEADEQRWQIARNNALPRLDAVGQYRWNGLSGTTPNGAPLSSEPGAFTDWTLGVNFSVPIGLRQSRANLRARELIVARDRVNLQQGLHAAVHQLAASIRNLSQSYEQYRAFREARQAALDNLIVQTAKLATGTVLFINVQQAVTDWGNLISAEAGALTQYNTLLATLERQTGTILETHAVVFYEERFGAIGPLGRFCDEVYYPRDMRPTPNADRYSAGEKPSEENFNLEQPSRLRKELEGLDYDGIDLPTLEEIMRDQEEQLDDPRPRKEAKPRPEVELLPPIEP